MHPGKPQQDDGPLEHAEGLDVDENEILLAVETRREEGQRVGFLEPPADPVEKARRVAFLHHFQDTPGLPAEAGVIGQIGDGPDAPALQGRLGDLAHAVEELEIREDAAAGLGGVDGPQAARVAAHEAVADPAGRAHLFAGQDIFQGLAPVSAQQLALEPLGLVVLPEIDPGGGEGPRGHRLFMLDDDDVACPLEALPEPAADVAARPVVSFPFAHPWITFRYFPIAMAGHWGTGMRVDATDAQGTP